ncbi:MAG: MOSC domain-containing protein [Acidobacteriota bacterium]
MKILSVNVGLPRIVEYHEEPVLTAIFKEPVEGKVSVSEFNLEGDRQADLRVHGGYSKAVYVYPSEHYEFWKNELPEMYLPFGIFGENLTSEGLRESEVFIGDRLRMGTAQFIVTEPRQPCYKLGIRFGRTDIIKRFAQSGRSGFYLAIEKTGELESGNEIEIIEREQNITSIADVVREKLKLK